MSNRRGILTVASLPAFIRDEVVANVAFQRDIEYSPGRTIHFADTDVTVAEAPYLEAVKALYAKPGGAQQVDTLDGQTLVLAFDPDTSERLAARVGERNFFVHSHPELAPGAEERLSGFDAVAARAGLPRALRAEWRTRLESGPLAVEEGRALNDVLEATPPIIARRLAAQFEGESGSMETIAPPVESFWTCLVGGGDPQTLQELAASFAAEHIPDLIAYDRLEGTKLATLVASHNEILGGFDWSFLTDAELAAMVAWAIDWADPFAQVGVVQIALMRGRLDEDLEQEVSRLVTSICDIDPADRGGRLHLFLSTYVLIEAELSRTKALANWPPFRRRAAAFAQAALFGRVALGKIEISTFSTSAFERGGRTFYFQTDLDLQQEPRWRPDWLGPEQIHAELVGRLNGLADVHAASLPDGPLKVALVDPLGPVRSALSFPLSFRPGPLEGAGPGAVAEMPPQVAEILDQSLSATRLIPTSLTALINLIGLFRIEPDKVEAAVELIKAAGHRISADDSDQEVSRLFDGLAMVACMSRNVDLADHLRIMCRRRRGDGATPHTPHEELLWALTASAAHAEFDDRRAKFGDWATELAFAVDNRDHALQLSLDLEAICAIEPRFRIVLGRALAALDGFRLS